MIFPGFVVSFDALVGYAGVMVLVFFLRWQTLVFRYRLLSHAPHRYRS
jgi:hypothetical protein